MTSQSTKPTYSKPKLVRVPLIRATRQDKFGPGEKRLKNNEHPFDKQGPAIGPS